MARWIKASYGWVGWAGIALAALPLAACGGGSDGDASASSKSGGSNTVAPAGPAATPTPAPVVEIMISDNAFAPKEITIKAGTTVKWVWSGANPHSVLVAGFKSETFTGSGEFVREFKSGSGTFNYQCGVHGEAMAGKIVIE